MDPRRTARKVYGTGSDGEVYGSEEERTVDVSLLLARALFTELGFYYSAAFRAASARSSKTE